MTAVPNEKVKRELLSAGMTQGELANVLGMTEARVSILLSTELHPNVQRAWIAKIREQKGE